MSDTSIPTHGIDYDKLIAELDAAPDGKLLQVMVDAPFDQKLGVVTLFLGFICIYKHNVKTGTVQLVATSHTEQYELAVENFNFTPSDYVVSLTDDPTNTIVQAVASGKSMSTADWGTLSRRGVQPEVAKLNQANSGIACSTILPLTAAKFPGAIMYNYYQIPEQIGDIQQAFMDRYNEIIVARFDR